ncbi:MAG: hypothetical protein MR274_01960 [Clostridium sp.]|nr:hypothetical protein [Clostridium sp.]MDY3827788.1 hypothetical protein [Clostridium sp.]
MGFKDKISSNLKDAYLEKYGDRITSASGTVLSIKITDKNYIILKKLVVDIVIKSDVSKGVVKARYKKKRWFKKIEFIPISMGHKIMIMGLKGVKGKKDSDVIEVQNILNLTNKRDLMPFDHSQLKKARQQKMRYQR